MALPININELINGRVVEWDRIEFKKGWNPEAIIRTICAFSNDINNWGGGYIIIGFNELNGRPVLPPVGLNPDQLDTIQGALLNLSYQIQPNYFPISQPEMFMGKHIFIIWVPAGDSRPYSSPVTLNKKSERACFVRRGSLTIAAKGETQRQLLKLAARIPFDDRVNQQATIEDFNLSLMQAYLKEVKSILFDESPKIPFDELCRQMAIVRGPAEYLLPVNVGLLFFSNQPHRHFNRARIEIVIHQDDSGRNFIEKIIEGPLHYQLRNAMDYLKTRVIQEK